MNTLLALALILFQFGAVHSEIWTNITVGPYPLARDGSCGVVDLTDSKFVLFGGNNENGTFYSDLNRFVFATNSWDFTQPSGVGPSGVYWHSCVLTSSNNMITFGGEVLGAYSNYIYSYSVASHSWVKLNATGNTMPAGRVGHKAVITPSNNMIVIGGGTLVGYSSETWQYSIAANTWTLLANDTVRMNGAAVYYNNYVYYYGGYTSVAQVAVNNVWRFDVNAKVWTDVTPLNSQALAEHTAVLVGNRMVVVGNPTSNPIYLDLDTLTWSNPQLMAPYPSVSYLAVTVTRASGALITYTGNMGANAQGVIVLSKDMWTYGCTSNSSCYPATSACVINVCSNQACVATGATGAPCDDGLFCTAVDTCNSTGTCVGTGNPCSADAVCNNTCSEIAKNCYASLNGNYCNLGGPNCTVDWCSNGKCILLQNNCMSNSAAPSMGTTVPTTLPANTFPTAIIGNSASSLSLAMHVIVAAAVCLVLLTE